MRVIARNKKASFNYFIEEKFEAGIVLKGGEVKSVRLGKATVEDAHAADSGGELFLYNASVTPYEKAGAFSKYSPRRPRKLLLKRKEINKIIGKIRTKGYSLIALSLYFDEKNRVKVELGIGKGKKLHDKRADIKEKDWKREKERLFKKKI